MAKIKISLTASGGGPTIPICEVDSLEQATGVVTFLEDLWKLWCEGGYSESWPLYIRYYEGCDIYAEDQGTLYAFVSEWEKENSEGINTWESV